jgi:hypothetical protein
VLLADESGSFEDYSDHSRLLYSNAAGFACSECDNPAIERASLVLALRRE